RKCSRSGRDRQNGTQGAAHLVGLLGCRPRPVVMMAPLCRRERNRSLSHPRLRAESWRSNNMSRQIADQVSTQINWSPLTNMTQPRDPEEEHEEDEEDDPADEPAVVREPDED